ncbi:protein cft-1 [Neurospora crassa]|uniref:Protein cft1 n=1 Tax=Neurospora crassa (strain ATCC 24698 / 74-OR23-1A / CBS 708.71 / DSM 1257 / FGSC 987) TaxID=367110 RepID=CFT1_NEUCR|nr:cft-1 [Neurospora crassa OR74A]Q7SEY2.3 RecName: Full=Protein cft1; AltName: Full=Cleavage factor two protein 1; AltName: Full=Polyadenylation factor 3 [Neurospora crassa OR74A]EAA35373.3 cft-1 [Neurospora crassa OR74A]KHE89065.1 protein cft-1 [Neurospora crassa]|eukprot:XP_964609.3 cft-1 [Neurospora crassa OR74A]
MQCYTELTPPTAVTHSVTLQLVPGQGTNLAVAKASLLQIFKTKVVSAEIDTYATLNGTNTSSKAAAAGRYDSRLVNDDDGFEASFLGGDNIAARADRANSAKLVLVAEVTLPGTMTGLARIKKPSGSSSGGADCLLLSFRDARLSLVEWNVERNTLETVSIHYYEKEELVGSPWVAPLHQYPTLLVADPASRCAALKFSERNLAILPFKQPDEDMDMDNWDEELDGPRPKKDLSGAVANGASTIEDTPYSPSFVLRLSKLEASLLHPVHLAFLHEYRDPTIGVLSSTKTASNSLGHKDHFTYMVFTLDLQQRASTTILAVNGLPQDLFRVVALPAPVGGALLVGANELIHIDQSGKSNGIAVNPLTKQTTSFSLVDQADLDLRLEGCAIDVLAAELGEFLLILNDGRLGLITFRIDGRTVSGLSIKMIAPEAGGSVIQSRVTSLSRMGRSTMFVGSEEGDSVLLGWTRRQGQTQKRKSRLQDADLDLDLDDEDLEDDDDDDLYGEESASPEQAMSAAKAIKSGDLNFRIHDRLLSIAPIQKMTYGQPVTLPDSEEERNSEGVRSDLQLVCAVGRGKASALAIMNLAIQPKIIGRFEFPEARGFWTVCAKKPIPKTLVGDKGPMNNDYDTSGQYHKFMIVAKVDLDGYETSDVYALTAAGFESLTGTEFEPAAGFTVEAGTMGKDSRILQVLKSEVRCYDGDLGLSQIVPMLDEETGAEPRVRTASIADPFLLLIRDDFSVFIAEMSPKLLELEEVEKEDQILTSTKWLAGCLYTDTSGVFADETVGKGTKDNILMFLLSTSGVLYIYRLPDLTKPVYVAEGLSYIPPGLSADYAARKGTAKESVAEILVADLGDTTHKSPYLILRHANDDLTLYQPYRLKATAGQPFSKSLFFQKVPNSTFAKAPEEKPADDDEPHNAQRFLPMRRCSNISGYSTVFLPGSSPSFILKTAKSSPRVLSLQGSGVQAMSSFHTEGCEHGFIYADTNGIARVTQIPTDSSYAELGLSVKKIPIGVDTQSVAYHPPTQAYVVGCNDVEPFELPKDDDYHKEWARENITFKPMVDRGVLKLLSGITWTVIDTVEMEPCETVLCVETLNLEVSESTNERKQLIAVGTALIKGEDLPTRGRVYVFDIADVIPEPGKPETSKKLKLVAKEDIPRGAVTALSEVGTQGLMLVAQGQKCMVRGLKEDGTLLPVAFMDMNCYVTSVKELPGTGLCLMADAFKGVWFTGYTEEPYKMMLFGKSSTRMEVLNADFLPDGKELYIVASDADGHIHILQFDPEHPKSLQGHLLLHRTTFNTGAHHPTSSLLLPAVYPNPSSLSSNSEENSPHILLLASPTGVLATLRPLQENAYRRLSSLAVQLTNGLPHPAGLNPKGYRLPSPSASASMQLPGVDAGIGRNIVDGKILERFLELGTGKRQEMAGRAGYVVGTGAHGVNPAGSGKMMGGGGGLSLGGLRLNGLHGQEGGMEWEEVRGELGVVLGWSGLGYF